MSRPTDIGAAIGLAFATMFLAVIAFACLVVGLAIHAHTVWFLAPAALGAFSALCAYRLVQANRQEEGPRDGS